MWFQWSVDNFLGSFHVFSSSEWITGGRITYGGLKVIPLGLSLTMDGLLISCIDRLTRLISDFLYRQTDNGQISDFLYWQTDNGRISDFLYRQTDNGRISDFLYRQTDNGRISDSMYRYKQTSDSQPCSVCYFLSDRKKVLCSCLTL